jgi:hypothetical protein
MKKERRICCTQNGWGQGGLAGEAARRLGEFYFVNGPRAIGEGGLIEADARYQWRGASYCAGRRLTAPLWVGLVKKPAALA